MEGRIRAAQIQAIFRFTPMAMAINCANVVLMVLALRYIADPWALAGWALLPMSLALLALNSWVRSQRQPRRATASHRAFRRATIHAGLLGFVWGLLPLLWFPSLGIQEQLVVASVATGISPVILRCCAWGPRSRPGCSSMPSA